jgi:hypothetical protein
MTPHTAPPPAAHQSLLRMLHIMPPRTAAAAVQRCWRHSYRRCAVSSAAAGEHWGLPPPQQSVGGAGGGPLASMAGPTPTCNWLVPGRVLVGGFPAVPGDGRAHHSQVQILPLCYLPSLAMAVCASRPGGLAVAVLVLVIWMCVAAQLTTLLEAGVRLFVMLNAEVPRESDHDGRAVFERPWYRAYEADVRSLANGGATAGQSVAFIHHAMRANTAGHVEDTARLVLRLQTFVEAASPSSGAVYIHCSGGHGRAGTVAACLLGALEPSFGAEDSLSRVQAYHDQRQVRWFRAAPCCCCAWVCMSHRGPLAASAAATLSTSPPRPVPMAHLSVVRPCCLPARDGARACTGGAAGSRIGRTGPPQP